MNYKEEIMSNEFTKHLLDFDGKEEPFHMVLHHFTDIDKGGPHDHPFKFRTHILKGGYIERRYNLSINPDTGNKTWSSFDIEREAGTTFEVAAGSIHEIIALPKGECWTVIIPEEKTQEPGFWRFGESIEQRRWNEKDWTKLT